jgi:hypothetical protein
VVLKTAVCAVAALAASAGCKQSLFDSNVDDPAGDDASVTDFDAAATPDADPNAPDGPVFDADPGQPDAPSDGPPCPTTCKGDAARDYDGTPSGSAGVWRYVSDPRDRTWTQMSAGTYMGLDAMVGTGDPAPAIVNCRDNPTDALCAGNAHRLLLIPSDAGAGNADPAVEFTVASTGAFTVSGEFLAQSAAGNHRLRIYRNTRDDMLHDELFPTDTTVRSYSVDVEASAQDRLLIAFEPETAGMAVPIGAHIFVSESVGEFPRGCFLTARFESAAGPDLVDDCGLVSYEVTDYADGSLEATDAVLVASAISELGTAIRLTAEHYVTPSGSTMDYTGSFTIDFWLQISVAAPAFGTVFADWHNIPQGGINISVSSSSTFYATVLHDPGDSATTLSFAYPDDGNWHFVRVVRDAGKNRFRTCVDGQLRASTSLSGLLDLTTDQSPYLGRNVDYNPPDFDGAIDDVRVFNRAYPCGPP